MGILALEQSKTDRPLAVRHQGAVVFLPDPVDLTHREIAGHVQTQGRFLIPEARMPLWKADLLLERWLAHHGIGTLNDFHRLSFLVERYEGHLVWDLQSFAGVDLGELWRARKFRQLLQLIDHLPRHSYYSDAVANDPEHSKMIAEAQARAKKSDDDVEPGLPLIGWTPEVAALARVTDAVKAVQYTLALVNSDPKKAAPKPPAPEPRPTTLLQRELKVSEHRVRQEKHEALANRMLARRKKAV